MAKDPAFLFYYQDFLVGIDHMTDEQIGQYIKCLCHQANRGSIREEHMLNICRTQVNHNIVQEKFLKDKNGEFYNKRLRFEIEKRVNYCESRRNNRLSEKTYVPHMENENIVLKDKGIVKGKRKFRPPTLEQVKEYAKEIKSHIDPELFFHTYESSGWIKANGQRVLNWKSTLQTWDKKQEVKNDPSKIMAEIHR